MTNRHLMNLILNETNLVTRLREFMRMGITPETNRFDQLKIRIFNALLSTGILIILINIIFTLFSRSGSNRHDYIISNSAALTAAVFILWQMRKGHTTLAFAVAFIFFPLCIFFMTIFYDDRAVMYFQIIFAIYTFFFFNSYRLIIPISVLIWFFFFYGVYHQFAHQQQTAAALRGNEILNYIYAALLFYFTLHFFAISFRRYQQKVTRQQQLLRITNTALKQRESLLTERNQTLNKVFSIVSHDLRGPVEGLKLIMRSARNDEQLEETLKELLPDFKKELLNMSSLFENLIAWARIEMHTGASTEKEVDMNGLVNKVVNQIDFHASAKHISIERYVERFLTHNGDPNVLEILLRNLLSNAVKFTPDGGKVTIRAGRQGEFIYLHVADTGIGMSAEIQAAITGNRFFSTKGTRNELGTGLGLMICRDLIERSGGTLHIASAPGKGTLVSVSILSVTKSETTS